MTSCHFDMVRKGGASASCQWTTPEFELASEPSCTCPTMNALDVDEEEDEDEAPAVGSDDDDDTDEAMAAAATGSEGMIGKGDDLLRMRMNWRR